MSREEPDPRHRGDEALEELLRAAQWPEAEPERLARLERRWHALVAAQVLRRRRRRALLALAAVAAALLAAVLVWQAVPREDGATAGNPGADRPSTEGPLNDRQSHDRLAPKPAPDPPRPSVAASRPASPFEKIAFRALTRRRHTTPQSPPDDPLDVALRALVQDPAADLDKLAGPLLAARRTAEARLTYEIRRSSGPRRTAAVRLLGRVGSQRSVSLLYQLTRVPDLHDASVRALVRVADADTLARLATAESDARLRRDLVSALLNREEKAALPAYLGLVAAPSTRATALELLDRRPDLSREALFEFLCGPYPCLRQGAALVLGRLDGPETYRRLMEMVTRGVHRQEALMALLASPGPDAAQFLAQARADPSLAGALISAQYQLGMSCL